MANLDRLVVRDLLLIESATWWKDCPEVESGELSPETNENEAFLFSATAHTEKSGSVTNTNRMQWHDEAVEPEGDARSDVWFMYTSFGSSATNGAHTWGNVT
jgi:formate dehydrogenase major subunit